MTPPESGSDKPSPKDSARRVRSPLSVGLMLMLLVAMVYVLGGDMPQKTVPVTQETFWYDLYTARVENTREMGSNNLEYTLQGDAPDTSYRVSFGDLEGTRERIQDVRSMTPGDAYDPVTLTVLTADLESGRTMALQGYPILHVDEEGLEMRRFFVLAEVDGLRRYFEVVGHDGGAPDQGALVAGLRSHGAEIVTTPGMDERKATSVEVPSQWTPLLLGMVPWILMIVLFYFIFLKPMRAQGGPGGVMSFGKAKASLYSKEKNTGITFEDVAGVDEAKDELAELVEFLRQPQKFQRLGGRIPRGVLLVGAPGTGKTLLAKAIAGEAGVPFFSISGSDFVEMFVGVGASRVRDLFRKAKEAAPCILFLDEIDAVGRRRGSGMGGGHDEREQTLNAILVEMDGFETEEGVIVLAASNRPDVLDPALLRPGRFDREIVIDMPDVKGREAILGVHAAKVEMSADVDLGVLARSTPMFSGADLAAIINEAAILAAMKEQDSVTLDDLEESRDKVRFGRQKKSRVMSEDDNSITAHHESGHALVAALLEYAEKPHKVTIIPRGAALGATMMLPEGDRYHMQKRRCMHELAVLFAGRIAEDIFCGDISAGASNDIERATELARRMICEWGMSERIGPVNFSEARGSDFLGNTLQASRWHSDEMAYAIDQEVKAVLDEGYALAEGVIRDHQQELKSLALDLLEFETLTGEEVALVIDGKSVADHRRAKEEAQRAQEDEQQSEETVPEPEPEADASPDEEPLAGGEGLAPA